MKVGFIGLGVMGGPMAANILKGGHSLTVFDLNPASVATLTAAGAKAAASPRDVGAASDIVVTMLPLPSHVEQVYLGPNGVGFIHDFSRRNNLLDATALDQCGGAHDDLTMSKGLAP